MMRSVLSKRCLVAPRLPSRARPSLALPKHSRAQLHSTRTLAAGTCPFASHNAAQQPKRSFRATRSARGEALSQQTIDTVKATAPVLAEHGYTIVKNFYKHMFENNPEVRAMFNQTHQVEKDGQKAQQPLTLACTVHAYAQYIDNPGVLEEAIERIVHKHVSLYVLPEQYAVVGSNLLWAIKHTLGDAATPEIMKAWEEAYGYLADIFIDRERALREQLRDQPGGWEGWRSFDVVDKVVESSIISSFYLKPSDGGALPMYKPGQYSGIVVDVPGKERSTRNYTLSSTPGLGHFRITVKREPGGIMSNHLHDNVNVGDSVQLGVPCGDFFLPDNLADKPICFISGGVGLTPMLSMMEYALDHGFTKKPIVYLDVVRNADVEPMHAYFERVSHKHLNVNVKFIYDDPPSDEYPQGPITIDHIKTVVQSTDSHFFLCGPPGFMQQILKDLEEWGVPKSQVHHEVFGSWGPV